jgi:polyphosphate kinase
MKPPADRYFNRELSWLAFNQRVLEEGLNEETPLLERLKFLAITASNLDEFFMVRVGGLKSLLAEGHRGCDIAGLTVREQLQAVTRRVRKMSADQSALYRRLRERLAESGFRMLSPSELGEAQRNLLLRAFEDDVLSILTPVSLVEGRVYRPANLLLHLAVRLAPADGSQEERYAVLPLGPNVGRFFRLPAPAGAVFVRVEEAAAEWVGRWFDGCEVLECAPFRVTRNADIELREDLAPDLLTGMQELLDERKETACIRLEVSRKASRPLVAFLARRFEVDRNDIYPCDGPLALRALMKLAEAAGFESLKDPPWPPQPSPLVDLKESLFPQIAARNILLHAPYESFDPVVKLVEDAAEDPDVLAIKQVLYRTAGDSAIVEALIRAAQSGKHVTVLVELKARFDEARNISQARRLEKAGAEVIYGVRNLKTHAKVCLVVRREAQGIVRYMHFGTGNYNEVTARLYSDLGYLTCDAELGRDAAAFFNAVAGYSQPQDLHQLRMSPFDLRSALMKLIDTETGRAKAGEKASMMIKVNTLTDAEMIDHLYRASQAGVRVQLNVRGVCCLRPGVRGLSENIEVTSLIDRFLEHARICAFHNGGNERVYIASADWMPRNLDRRVELMIPIQDKEARRQVLKILKSYFKDNRKAWRLLPDGSYVRVEKGKSPFRCQEVFYSHAREAARRKEQTKPTVLEPHRRALREVPGAAGGRA